MKTIERADLREELMDHLLALSDPVYQQNAWIQRNFPAGVLDDGFKYVVHFLFDDWPFADNVYSTIGWVLLNQNEAEALKKVITSIDALLNLYGGQLSDTSYIAKPEWKDVVDSARLALRKFGVGS